MYVSRRAVRSFADGLERGDPLAIGILVFTGLWPVLLLAAIPVGNYKFNKIIKDINSTVAQDLGDSTHIEMQTFETSKIELDDTDKNFLVRLTGRAITVDDEIYNFANATYRVSYKNFEKLQKEAKDMDSDEISCFTTEFLKNLLSIIQESDLVDTSIVDIASIENDEIVIDVSEPSVDEENNVVSYQINLMKLKDKDLKVGNFTVSAKLNNELKSDPRLVYLKDKNDCDIKLDDVKTYHDVNKVIKHGDAFMTM